MCGRVRASFWSLLERRAESAWRDSSSRDRELLRSVLMTTCDVAAITKPWHVQLRAAKLVLTEFFDQGDLEKHQLNIQPQVTRHRRHYSRPSCSVAVRPTVVARRYSMPVTRAVFANSRRISRFLRFQSTSLLPFFRMTCQKVAKSR